MVEEYWKVLAQPSPKTALEKAKVWYASVEEFLSLLESSEEKARHLTSLKSTGLQFVVYN